MCELVHDVSKLLLGRFQQIAHSPSALDRPSPTYSCHQPPHSGGPWGCSNVIPSGTLTGSTCPFLTQPAHLQGSHLSCSSASSPSPKMLLLPSSFPQILPLDHHQKGDERQGGLERGGHSFHCRCLCQCELLEGLLLKLGVKWVLRLSLATSLPWKEDLDLLGHLSSSV